MLPHYSVGFKQKSMFLARLSRENMLKEAMSAMVLLYYLFERILTSLGLPARIRFDLILKVYSNACRPMCLVSIPIDSPLPTCGNSCREDPVTLIERINIAIS